MADKGNSSNPSKKKSMKNFWLWRVASSVKFTVFILLSVALLSIVGTVVEQNRPLETYVMSYGEEWAEFIMTYGLNDMYHATWFTFMLVLLITNIIACTIDRFPSKWKSLLWAKKDFDPAVFERLSRSEEIQIDKNADSAALGVRAILKKKRFKVRESEEGGKNGFYAERGIIGRFGSDFVHLSLLVIILGAILGSFLGYKDYIAILVDGEVEIPNTEIGLRLDNFWIDRYESGQIKQYNSELVVLDKGEEVYKKHIWVNEPMVYKGIRFYQSSWGISWNRIAEAEVTLVKNKVPVGDPVLVDWLDKNEFAGTPFGIKLVGYVSDFAFDMESRTVYSKSGDVENPATMLEVYRNGEVVSTPWTLLHHHGIMATIPGEEGYEVYLTGIRNINYSGISINKDPGTNIVWIGCLIMGLGCYLSFFVYHRRMWIEVAPFNSGVKVKVCGMINKNQMKFDKEFAELLSSIKNIA